jgi:multicomponent Na+:H+ antiporter subunit E
MTNPLKKDFKGFVLLAFLLLLFWLLLSASFDWQHILAGVVIALLLTAFWGEIIFTGSQTRFSVGQVFGLAAYLASLVLEIIKANFHVAYLVLHPHLPISPGFVTYHLDLEKDLTTALFLNSITLTPGTITVEYEVDRLVVHCITRENAEAVQHWSLYQKIKKLEEGEPGD